jgi:predicted restriction endonuclease
VAKFNFNRLINKEAYKKLMGRCFFCENNDYKLLDAHRITPGCEGGKYSVSNVVVLCKNCHRLNHTGDICIDRKYPTTIPGAQFVVHFWKKEDEKMVEYWTPEMIMLSKNHGI